MLKFNPYRRLSVEECLNHPYFKELRCDNIPVKDKILLDIDKDNSPLAISDF